MLKSLIKKIALLMLVVLTLSACEQSPQRQAQGPTRVVAVAPFSVAQPLRDQPQRFGGSSPEAASRLVTREIVESLRERGAGPTAGSKDSLFNAGSQVPIRDIDSVPEIWIKERMAGFGPNLRAAR